MHTQLRRSIQHSQKYAAYLEERIRQKEKKEKFKKRRLWMHDGDGVESAEMSFIKAEVEDEQEAGQSQQLEDGQELEDKPEIEDNRETKYNKSIYYNKNIEDNKEIEDDNEIENSENNKEIEDTKDIEDNKEIVTQSEISTLDEKKFLLSANVPSLKNFSPVTDTPTILRPSLLVMTTGFPTSQPLIGTYVSGTHGLGIRLPAGWPLPECSPKATTKAISKSKPSAPFRQKKEKEVARAQVAISKSR
ncbi:unnamed protein product, partial [Lymnaea stagnalis]